MLAGEISYFSSTDCRDVDINKLVIDNLNQNDCTADNVFEQYDNSVDDEPEQDSSLANAQNELGNPTSKNEDAFEETTIVQQIDQDNNADTQKELEIMTSVLEESGMCSAGGCRPGMCSCLWASSGRSYSMANTKECLI